MPILKDKTLVQYNKIVSCNNLQNRYRNSKNLNNKNSKNPKKS